MHVVTSESGRFVLMGVPTPSIVTLDAQKAGLLQGAYGQRAPGASSQMLSLLENEWKADLSVPLWETGAIEGRVATILGEAAAQVSVIAFRHVTLYGTRRYVQGPGAQTDDRGVYRIEGLVPGDYILAVVSAQLAAPSGADARSLGGQPNIVIGNMRALLLGNVMPPAASPEHMLVYPTTYYPSSPAVSGAAPVVVAAGSDRSHVDFLLTPVRPFRLSGRVQPSALADAGTTLRMVRASDRDAGINLPVAVTRPDSDGQFTFLGVCPGDYVIESVPQVGMLRTYGASPVPLPDRLMPTAGLGESDTTLRDVEPALTISTIERQRRQEFWARAAVSVLDRDVTGVVVTMYQSARMTGVVELDSDNAGTLASAGNAARRPGLVIRAEPADARVELSGAPAAFVERSGGKFVLTGLLPGKYVLRVADRLTKAVEWRGQDWSDRPLEVDGSDVDGLVLRVTEASAVVEGAVTKEDRSAAEDAVVLCFPVLEDQWTNYGLTPRRVRTARTSSAGRYRIQGLPAGEYFIVAVPVEDASKWQDPAYLREAAKRATRVGLDWDRVVSVNLTRVDRR